MKGRPPRRAGRDRAAGYTLVELAVALVCLSILLALSVRALAGVAGAASRLQHRGAWLEAARSARWVLHSELEDGEAGRDWKLSAPDSAALRAFRGLALVCSAVDDSTFMVRARSARRPDPAKDSVLALREDGTWVAAHLVAVTPASSECPDSTAGSPERWRVRGLEGASGAGARPAVFRLFETGAYQVTGAALRYRRGEAGAQPLTEAVLHGARLVGDTGLGAAALLEVDGPGRPEATWTVRLVRSR